MVVRVETPRKGPARRTSGKVSGASANEAARPERPPFSREYMDYWAALSDATA